jgi:hypothetical protein
MAENYRISQQLDPEIETMVWAEAEYMENRLGRIATASAGHYYWSHIYFAEAFLNSPEVSVKDVGNVVLVGYADAFGAIMPFIQDEFETVTESAGREPERIMVFVGDQYTMEYNYRMIGPYPPPYAHAVSGGLSCYINADKLRFDLYGNLDKPMARAVRHEPRHAMLNSLRQTGGVPTMDLSADSVAYEALGGPLDYEAWRDVDEICNVDFTELEAGSTDFAAWYACNTVRTSPAYRHVPFFENPVAKAFYNWAISMQEREGPDYWFKRAGILSS